MAKRKGTKGQKTIYAGFFLDLCTRLIKKLWYLYIEYNLHSAWFLKAGLPYKTEKFITGYVTRLTQQVRLGEQELRTLPEYLSSPPVFSGVCVTRSLVLCV
jgi:hypothetical protein